jgi:lysophospholipase L1-like esterase
MLLDMTHTAREQEYPTTLAAVSRELALPLVVYEGPRIDVVHPTPDGYRTLAQEVLATMRKEGYVLADPSARVVTTADRTPVDPGR